MGRVAGGDVFAYTAIVKRHSAAVFRAGYRMLHDREEAEDVAQESFARLWQNAARWCGTGGGVPAWLHRVCLNLCFDRLRKRGRIAPGDVPDLADPAISAERVIERGQVQERLESCMAALSDTHRAAVVLTYYEEHPNRIAAEIMGMDIKAFESLLYRARQRLGALLAEGGVVPRDLELLA